MYLLDIDRLQIGDIILTSYANKNSKRIKRLLKSDYSHALLCVNRGSCIESFEQGIHSENIQRMLFPKKEDVCILRAKNIKDISASFSKK